MVEPNENHPMDYGPTGHSEAQRIATRIVELLQLIPLEESTEGPHGWGSTRFDQDDLLDVVVEKLERHESWPQMDKKLSNLSRNKQRRSEIQKEVKQQYRRVERLRTLISHLEYRLGDQVVVKEIASAQDRTCVDPSCRRTVRRYKDPSRLSQEFTRGDYQPIISAAFMGAYGIPLRPDETLCACDRDKKNEGSEPLPGLAKAVQAVQKKMKQTNPCSGALGVLVEDTRKSGEPRTIHTIAGSGPRPEIVRIAYQSTRPEREPDQPECGMDIVDEPLWVYQDDEYEGPNLEDAYSDYSPRSLSSENTTLTAASNSTDITASKSPKHRGSAHDERSHTVTLVRGPEAAEISAMPMLRMARSLQQQFERRLRVTITRGRGGECVPICNVSFAELSTRPTAEMARGGEDRSVRATSEFNYYSKQQVTPDAVMRKHEPLTIAWSILSPSSASIYSESVRTRDVDDKEQTTVGSTSTCTSRRGPGLHIGDTNSQNSDHPWVTDAIETMCKETTVVLEAAWTRDHKGTEDQIKLRSTPPTYKDGEASFTIDSKDIMSAKRRGLHQIIFAVHLPIIRFRLDPASYNSIQLLPWKIQLDIMK
eukprot:TRINITY_DN1337_c0_g1_i3.p1 TRINITY_DN1337_c0_g1~~TRINITY_DN1337_c0_g1_i3.p1  ORF type:complete len:594 (-),score=6.01 TRINITY_DN1337_c0_g1_i3:222-2003(-)